MGKGSNYERELCKRLSLWWSKKSRDDIFWRSNTSGAWATTRRRAGKTSFLQAGDIAAIDPIGIPLLEFTTIECKRGYSSDLATAVIEKLPHQGPTQFEKWLEQVTTDQQYSGSKFWTIITRRNKASDMIWFPFRMQKVLKEAGAKKENPFPYVTFQCRFAIGDSFAGTPLTISGTTLDNWLKVVKPDHVKRALEICND